MKGIVTNGVRRALRLTSFVFNFSAFQAQSAVLGSQKITINWFFLENLLDILTIDIYFVDVIFLFCFVICSRYLSLLILLTEHPFE